MPDEKNCPYCAETIKAEAVKCRYCGSDLSEVQTPEVVTPQSTASTEEAATPKQAGIFACPECNIEMIKIERKKSVSISGILGALIFIIGLIAIFINVIAGAVLLILGVVLGLAGRGKQTVMACPKCGHEGSKL